jgi:hypothetical protein
VRGFAGRTLVSDGERRGPKYVNSPESDLFHKGRQLFGADIARAAAAKAGSVVVAEGYTDVIALHQAGVRNSVGIMGTSLTEEQVAGLMRLAPLARLALDADAAGREAMLRSARVAADRKLALEVIALPRARIPPISSGTWARTSCAGGSTTPSPSCASGCTTPSAGRTSATRAARTGCCASSLRCSVSSRPAWSAPSSSARSPTA